MAILSLSATTVLAVAQRVFEDTNTVVDRRDVFNDGRVALDELTKHLRQAESVDAASTASAVTMPTYLDGTGATVVWRAVGTSAPYALERSTDGGVSYVEVLDSLASPEVFTYVQHDGVTDQVTVAFQLTTSTTVVELTTDIYLRNV